MAISKKVKLLVGFIILILILIIIAALFLFPDLRRYLWNAKQIRIIEKKCKEYTKYACDHPLVSKSGSILLGEIAPPGMYPHMALLEFRNSKEPKNLTTCGGSLISEYFILSAVHCIELVENVVGVAKLGSVNRTGEAYTIKRYHVFPFYDEYTVRGDFLLLELDRKVEFTPYKRPICINTNYLGKYDRIIATGWGLTEDGNISQFLRSADVVIDGAIGETCSAKLEEEVKYFICGGWPNSTKSVHSGDSGGPLQVILDSKCNMYEQIGVTSTVQNRPYIVNKTLLSHYGKIANVAPWIANIVWPNESA